jgi:hypothetical protein
MGYKSKSVDGVVMNVDERTAGEHRIATVRVKDADEKIWVCLFWNEDCHSVVMQNVTGKRIYAEGGLRGDNEISVRYFTTDFGGNKPRNFQQSDPDALREYLEKHNRVVVGNMRDGRCMYYSQHKRYCVKVNGMWESKIEYCCRVLGDATVYEFLESLRGGSPSAVLALSEKYKEKLQEMLNHCAAINGDYLEYENESEVEDRKAISSKNSRSSEDSTSRQSNPLQDDREWAGGRDQDWQ